MSTENNINKEWQNKKEKMKKVQFFRELEQLKLQKHTVERERSIFLYEKHDRQYTYLQEMEKSLDKEIKSERLKIDQQLKKMRQKVNEFQKELRNVKPTPQFVENLKISMEGIEATINDFKQQQRQVFESLMISEKETEQEIAALEGKIAALKEGGAGALTQNTRGAKVQMKTQVRNVPKEIKQFEAFVAETGGMQGGWDDYDHGTFLRIRDKFRGKPGFIPAAVRQIPGRSEQDVTDHEKWYSLFLEFKNKKKEAISVWRKEKEEKENVEDGDNSEDEAELKGKKEREEMRMRKIKEERETEKERLMNWKSEKEKKLRSEEEKRIQEEKQKQEIEKRKQHERVMARKVAQEILKERRGEEERLRWMQEFETEQLKLERQQEVRERIYEFQNRDRAVLNSKQAEQQKKLEIERMNKARLEKARLKVKVEKDPSRLYQLTEGWVQRTRDKSESSADHPPLHMPHRAIPSWRQNL